jgi:LTXXQ motif family protein
MKATFKTTLLGGGLAIISAALIASTAKTAPEGRSRDKFNVSYHEKSQSRLPTIAKDEWLETEGDEKVQIMDASPSGDRPFGGPLGHRMPPFGLELPPGPMARGPFGPPSPAIPVPRAACEGEIDLLLAHVAYLKSRMRLQGDQKAAWHKVEQTAEPSLEKLRDLCEMLPSQPSPPPAPPEALDFAEKQMTARLELLRAVRGSLQELYDILSPHQRTLLAPSLPPPLHFLEHDTL